MLDRRNYFKKYAKDHYKNKAHERRISLFNLIGEPVCKRCGFSDIRALQIDHVYGGGNQERKKNRNLTKLISEKPNNYQILCANCNWIKRVENNEVKGRPKN